LNDLVNACEHFWQHLNEFGKLAKENNTMIIPSNLSDVSGIIATATKVLEQAKR